MGIRNRAMLIKRGAARQKKKKNAIVRAEYECCRRGVRYADALTALHMAFSCEAVGIRVHLPLQQSRAKQIFRPVFMPKIAISWSALFLVFLSSSIFFEKSLSVSHGHVKTST